MRKNKDKFYYKDGTITFDERDKTKVLHRIGGPAVEKADGDIYWYIDNKLHRVGGPAVEFANKSENWYMYGKRHRLDGPAVEFADGTKWWYVDSEEYTEKQFDKIMKEVNEMSLAMKLTDPRWWVRELGEKEVISDYS